MLKLVFWTADIKTKTTTVDSKLHRNFSKAGLLSGPFIPLRIQPFRSRGFVKVAVNFEFSLVLSKVYFGIWQPNEVVMEAISATGI